MELQTVHVILTMSQFIVFFYISQTVWI